MAGKGTVGQLLVSMRADLTGLRTDVRELENTFRGSFANIQNMAGTFGRSILSGLIGGLNIAAVTSFTKSIIDLGGRLQDLSAQTGLSVQTLSGIKSVVEENGSSIDAFANGIFKLQKELGTIKNDADPAAQAIKALGLNLKELQNASPDQALKLITDALAKQENIVNRNALAFQLLGKTSREMVPAVVELAGKLEDLKRRGLTPEDVKILDDFGDAMTRASNAFKLAAATDIAGVFRELHKALELVIPLLPKLPEGLSDALQSFTSLTKGIQNTERELLALYQVFLRVLIGFAQFGEGLPQFDFQKRLRAAIIDPLKAALKEAQDLMGEIGQPSSHTPAEDNKRRAPFIPPIDTEAIKKATDQSREFIASLQKQRDALLLNTIELGGGSQAAKAFGLDLEFLAFKAKLAAEGLKLAPGTEQAFQKVKAEILALNIELAKTKELVERVAIDEKDWADTMEAINKAAIAPQIAADNLELQRRQELAEMMTRDFDAMASATREWGDATAEALRKADFDRVQSTIDFAKSISNSLTQGIRNTLQGIETGQQSLSEGMKNLARNMMLELQFALLDKTILDPLKAGIEGFVMGLVGTLDDTLKKQMEDWGKQAGTWLRELFQGLFSGDSGTGSGISGAVSGAASWIGSLFTFDQGGSIPFSRGMLATVPQFDSGGLFMGHGGEFVMRKSSVDSIGTGAMDYMNRTGRVPNMGGGSVVSVDFQNAQIIPRAPWTTPDDVVKVGIKHMNEDGTWVNVMGTRLGRK